MNRYKLALEKHPVVKDDESIVVYRKGSGGEILAIYNKVMDVVTRETPFNPKFRKELVYNHVKGIPKSLKLLHLQAVAVLRIKKISDIKNQLK